MPLPKLLGVGWIRDESHEPSATIDRRYVHQTDFEVLVYCGAEVSAGSWRFAAAIKELRRRKRYPSDEDLMLCEVLRARGGVAVNADRVCLRPLPFWLLDCAVEACWDNTIPEGDILSTGFVPDRPRRPVIEAVIEEIAAPPIRYDEWSWRQAGPQPFREWQTIRLLPFVGMLKRMQPTDFTGWSQKFLTSRRDGETYTGGGWSLRTTFRRRCIAVARTSSR